MDSREGKTDTSGFDAALTTLATFASVGATIFDVTHIDLAGKKTSFQPGRTLAELEHTIGRRLEEAICHQSNLIIRPRSATTTLIQLDDLVPEALTDITPYAFLILCTSPGNHQAWVAVEKCASKDMSLRLKRGIGADPTASGATRIAGSLNFKPKYAPNYPRVAVALVAPNHIARVEDLEQAGLIAPTEEPRKPAASVPPLKTPVRTGTRRWPDYDQALRGAPHKVDGRPDRSRADFMYCKWAIERGWSIDETAARLAEISTKARERLAVEDRGYPLLTAQNAAKAVDKDRAYRQAPSPVLER